MNNKAFTLVELMVVVAIIATLTAVSIPAISKLMNKARIATAQGDVASITTAIYTVYNDTGKMPGVGSGDSTGRGLNAPTYGLIRTDGSYSNWNGPYLDLAIGRDPWKREYYYDGGDTHDWTSPGSAGFGSPGENGVSQSWNRADLTPQGDDIMRYLHK